MPKPILEPLDWSAIAGWASDDHGDALEAFRRSAAEIIENGRGFARGPALGGERRQWLDACRKGQRAGDARAFFEHAFTPCLVHDPKRPEGLFTGYYEPQAEGRLTREPGFDVPIYRKPDDLMAIDEPALPDLKYGRRVGGRPQPYFTRKEIEQGALAGRGLELVWLNSWVEAFFIHIQGSGRISLPGAKSMRLAYGAKSGRAYSGIGGLLVARRVLRQDDMSMQSLRRWMRANPEAARELMWQNESFIFFREVEVADPSLGAPGAQQVPLHPLRSLAVDRTIWAFGTPVWLEAQVPSGPGVRPESFHRLMIAQDTGTAIRGHARGDVYWGWGEAAALAAGHMKSPGRMVALLPKPVAEGLMK